MDICCLLQFILIDKPPQVKYWPKITSNSIPMFGTAISTKTPCLWQEIDVSLSDCFPAIGPTLAQLVINMNWSVNLCSQMWWLFDANFWLYLCVFCASVATEFSLFQLIYFRQFEYIYSPPSWYLPHTMSVFHLMVWSFPTLCLVIFSFLIPLSTLTLFLSRYPNPLSLLSGYS